MRLLSFFVLWLCLAGTIQVKHAHAMCYTMSEAEAEQGVRIHSELMVISLNCQHMWPQKDNQSLFQQYRIFTANHANLFSGYDSTLIRFFIKNGQSAQQAEAKINEIRTAVANRISNDAAKMRPDLFCKTYAPRIEKASAMSGEKIRKWAQTFFDSHPVSYPLCKKRKKIYISSPDQLPRKKAASQ